MSNSIVQCIVKQTIAPMPSQLQKTGAFISQGATTLSEGSTALITQFSDLTAILFGAVSITSISWSGSVATVTTTTAHDIPIGDSVEVVISGVNPTGYNGTFLATSTGSSTFTYPLVSNPGLVTVQGSVTLEDVQELVAMATTWFAQGSNNAFYVLELGVGDAAQGVTALTTYLENPTVQFYGFLLPRSWSSEPTAITLASNHTNTTAKVYFWVTCTLGNYTNWSSLGYKSTRIMVEASNIPVTEFSLASMFWVQINYSPSSTNMVTPMQFAYVYGVTLFNGNQTTQAELRTANVNYIGNGAEGGISNTLISVGKGSDGNPVNYWYAVDWVTINSDLNISNYIINGSNNPTNPLYYNQNGINRLQGVAQSTMSTGISYGLILSPVTVNAVPFNQYVAINPSDYSIGRYAGLSVSFTPQNGFSNIIYNINVTSLVLP